MSLASRRSFLKSAAASSMTIGLMARSIWAATSPQGDVQVWVTDRDRRHASIAPLRWNRVNKVAADAIRLYSDDTRQEILGFGGAFGFVGFLVAATAQALIGRLYGDFRVFVNLRLGLLALGKLALGLVVGFFLLGGFGGGGGHQT